MSTQGDEAASDTLRPTFPFHTLSGNDPKPLVGAMAMAQIPT